MQGTKQSAECCGGLASATVGNKSLSLLGDHFFVTRSLPCIRTPPGDLSASVGIMAVTKRLRMAIWCRILSVLASMLYVDHVNAFAPYGDLLVLRRASAKQIMSSGRTFQCHSLRTDTCMAGKDRGNEAKGGGFAGFLEDINDYLDEKGGYVLTERMLKVCCKVLHACAG